VHVGAAEHAHGCKPRLTNSTTEGTYITKPSAANFAKLPAMRSILQNIADIPASAVDLAVFQAGPPRTDLTILSGVLVLTAELEKPQTFSGFGTRFRVDPTFGHIIFA
jgi:hypothetical protein